jgi:3-methyladenine DNA glycosylase AlkD
VYDAVMLSEEIISRLEKLRNPNKVAGYKRFFKTGKGEYGEGDEFWGISVPFVRQAVRDLRFMIKDLRIKALNAELDGAIKHPVHEVRLAALLTLVEIAKKYPKEAANYYLQQTKWVNNWDLVDLTAHKILGPTLWQAQGKPINLSLLNRLAESSSVWERRIAMITTAYFINQGNPKPALILAKKLMGDKHDLIHKASGWMLREVGKRCGEKYLTDYLDKNVAEMPRTMLRYAIERLPETKRQYYLRIKS